MEYEDLPEDVKQYIRDLKHGSYTIESDVEEALSEASDLSEFRLLVTNYMDELISEALKVRKLLGTG